MLATGTIIDDKYEIVSLLGAGGFGAVYAAVQKQFDRKVAIKLISTTLLQEQDGIGRFEREAKAISNIKHKNIVRFYGYGAWGQAPYMVMELIDGTSIDKILLDEARIEPARALRIIQQVFAALEAAHASGVVHRDLKPSNIMLVQDTQGHEQVKIIDFGLAKLMPGYGLSAQKLTETGYTLGTCYYMAPEQALGGQVDGRADVYAAGCILYHMIAGRPPFLGGDGMELIHQHLHETPQPLRKTIGPSALIDAIQTFIDNCMVKDPAERYQSAAAALADLDEISEKGNLQAVTPLVVQRKRSGRRINAKQLVPILLAVTVLAAASIVLMMKTTRATSTTRGQFDGTRYRGKQAPVPSTTAEAEALRASIDSAPEGTLPEIAEKAYKLNGYCRYLAQDESKQALLKGYLDKGIELRRKLPADSPAFSDLDLIETLAWSNQHGFNVSYLDRLLGGAIRIDNKNVPVAAAVRATVFRSRGEIDEADLLFRNVPIENPFTHPGYNENFIWALITISRIDTLVLKGNYREAATVADSLNKMTQSYPDMSLEPYLLPVFRTYVANKDYGKAAAVLARLDQQNAKHNIVETELIRTVLNAKTNQKRKLAITPRSDWRLVQDFLMSNYDLEQARPYLGAKAQKRFQELVYAGKP